nr:hypothetical protein Iba_chr01aCG3230 [Ipomoea batatas]
MGRMVMEALGVATWWSKIRRWWERSLRPPLGQIIVVTRAFRWAKPRWDIIVVIVTAIIVRRQLGRRRRRPFWQEINVVIFFLWSPTRHGLLFFEGDTAPLPDPALQIPTCCPKHKTPQPERKSNYEYKQSELSLSSASDAAFAFLPPGFSLKLTLIDVAPAEISAGNIINLIIPFKLYLIFTFVCFLNQPPHVSIIIRSITQLRPFPCKSSSLTKKLSMNGNPIENSSASPGLPEVRDSVVGTASLGFWSARLQAPLLLRKSCGSCGADLGLHLFSLLILQRMLQPARKLEKKEPASVARLFDDSCVYQGLDPCEPIAYLGTAEKQDHLTLEQMGLIHNCLANRDRRRTLSITQRTDILKKRMVQESRTLLATKQHGKNQSVQEQYILKEWGVSSLAKIDKDELSKMMQNKKYSKYSYLGLLKSSTIEIQERLPRCNVSRKEAELVSGSGVGNSEVGLSLPTIAVLKTWTVANWQNGKWLGNYYLLLPFCNLPVWTVGTWNYEARTNG